MPPKRPPKLELIHGGAEGSPRLKAGLESLEVDASKRIVDAVMDLTRRTPRLQAEHLGPKKLAGRIINELSGLDEKYDAASHEDQALYQLELGLRTLSNYAISGMSLEMFVATATRSYENMGGPEFRKEESTRVADGVEVLSYALAATNPTGDTAKDTKQMQYFIEDYCPSSVWQDPNIREILLESLEDAYWVTTLLAEESGQSIDRLLLGLHEGFYGRSGVELARGAPQQQAFAARQKAWGNWPYPEGEGPIGPGQSIKST